jgi:integrase
MHLTKRVVDGLEPRSKNYIVWGDGEIRFGVRVSPSGRKYFVLDYGTTDGKRRRLTLGRYGHVTLDWAQEEAKKKMAAVALGGDPLKDRYDAVTEVTFEEFKTVYITWARQHKKPATLRNDIDALDRLIEPEFKGRKLSAITRRDVARLHQKLGTHPAQANRTLAVLSHLFSMAMTWGFLAGDGNPCQHVKRYPESKRTRYLTTEELVRLGAALSTLEKQEKPKKSYPAAVRAVRLLLLTGCRLNEILGARWEDVDHERAVLRLPDAKTGPREVPLGAAAVDLLRGCGHESEWVIPGRYPNTHLVNLSKFWHEQVLPLAKLDCRIHDLRHTTGSVGASAGFSMLIVGAVLGHKQVGTTQRYSHLSPSPVHEAADHIAAKIAGDLAGEKAADVVALRS